MARRAGCGAAIFDRSAGEKDYTHGRQLGKSSMLAGEESLQVEDSGVLYVKRSYSTKVNDAPNGFVLASSECCMPFQHHMEAN